MQDKKVYAKKVADKILGWYYLIQWKKYKESETL